MSDGPLWEAARAAAADTTTIAAALSNSPLSDIALAIGPEGGWTADEMNLFTSHNWQPVTLGPRILRAETAAIAAIAITSSLYT